MSIIYQVLDVKKYRQEHDRDMWYVLFEHEKERGYTWQPSSVLGMVPDELRHKMIIMRRKWVATTKLKHHLWIISLWLLSGVSMASMAFVGSDRWRDTLSSPFKYTAVQITLPLCWWLVLGCLCSLFCILRALHLAVGVNKHNPAGLSHSIKFSDKYRPPLPTRVQPRRACRKN